MADSREAITLPEGEDFSCPECGKMLTEVEGKGGGGSKGPGKSKVALAGLAVVLLAVGGYFLLTSDEDTKKKTDTVVEDQKKKQDDSQKKAQEDAQKKSQEDAQRLQQEQQLKEQQAKEQQQREQQQREQQQREQRAQLEREQLLKQEKLKVRRTQESRKTADVADVATVEEPKYNGPSSGTIVWEGAVHGTEFVTIDNGSANKGALVSGKLPGIPVLIQPQNPKKVGIAGAPGPENKYQRVTLRVQGNGEMKVVLNWSLP